ncbi:restriction endonuclease subunit S [Vibrio sp. Vb2531]|uniref:restriction endonuclease subunit S n=1 Tax=Vibrio sp. Vb2531 TaxID=3074665 RepID=UPI0029657280|nr:restriction endonuclease subunit S [Vibrio sp. Vb2531]MDW1743601.1 restriction endonuclease subunit S [Vibrio sp. Vb2531]
MYKVRVLQEIDDRLDAEYYNPAALSTLKKMENKGTVTTFGSLVNEGYRVVYHGTDSINGLKDSELLPFLSPTQIDPNGAISFDDADKLPLYYKERYPKGLAKVGEILVEVKGNVSKVGIVPLDFPKNLMISGSLYKATLDPKRADSHYVLAFLKSRHGQILKNRLTSNTIINYIAKDALYSIPVIEFGEKAQKHIGDKVRQAEQLRAWAKRLRTSVDEKLNGLNLPINEPPQLLNRVSAQTMEDRLDPRPYRSHFLHLVSEIEKLPHDSISSVVGLASGCPVSSKDFLENAGIPLVRIRNIGFDDFIGLDTGVSKDVYQDASKYQAKEKMVVVGMDGIFRSQFFVADELPMLVNQRVAMLVPQKIRGELLTHWLNRPEGQMQLNQWAVKTTVEHTSLTDIGRVLIPRLDERLENKLADDLLNARLANRYAKFLTQTAKTLVEALIEGQLTEKQLIQAQQALDDGDNSLEQAILSKISGEGYAIEGAKPLFSDMDELYRLMESAAQAETEE